MKKKTFILGVGCQKGGTTWVYNQLSKHPQIDLGFAKEYHVFDALYLDDCKSVIDGKLQTLKKLIKNGSLMNTDGYKNILRWLDFYRNTSNYFDYFDYLYRKTDDVEIVGDITPSYSGLPQEAFERMKEGLEEKGFKLKVIFLMRDPVERIWSHVRMDRRNKLRKRPGHQFENSEKEDLLKRYTTSKIEFRTRYEKTIENLEAVFNKEDIFYGFYEQLFTVETVSRLEAFLGIDTIETDFDQQVNVSPKTSTNLDPEIVQKIVNYYRGTYNYCEERFSAKEIWGSYKFI